eukprot:COSAG01_NODE_24155_length_788_cov_1.747460_2_plen_33_part_01
MIYYSHSSIHIKVKDIPTLQISHTQPHITNPLS